MSPAIVLASASRTRHALMQRLRIPFDHQASDLDETPEPDESAHELVKRLSIAKAEAIQKQHPEAIIIAGDQVVYCEPHILGKPTNNADAHRQLKHCAGQTVYFYSGLCVMNVDQTTQYRCVETRARYRALSDTDITDYLNLDQPFHCAGSIQLESLGLSLIDQWSGDDPTAALGLPLITLCQFLRHCGVQIPHHNPSVDTGQPHVT